MPHQIIEYSANLETDLDIDGLVEALHGTAVSLDALPTAGIRTRAAKREIYRIADSHKDNTFINVMLRIAKGRDLETRQNVGATLFKTLRSFVADVYAVRPLALSLEIQEIEPDTRWKEGNIRGYLTERAARPRSTKENQ